MQTDQRAVADVGAPEAHLDPMLLYYREWWNLQSLKGDPARRPNLARDAYLSCAAQGALLARTTSVTLATSRQPAREFPLTRFPEVYGSLQPGEPASAAQVATEEPEPMFYGRWHHGNGNLCCGSMRYFRADFDTNPAPEVREGIFDWICTTMNAALDRWRAEKRARESEPDVSEGASALALKNLQTWLICREIGNALQPALTTVQGWVAALSPITGAPAPAFLMQAVDKAEIEPTVALCIEQLDLWAGRLERAIDRQAHEQLGQHPNDEPAAGGRDPMEQFP